MIFGGLCRDVQEVLEFGLEDNLIIRAVINMEDPQVSLHHRLKEADGRCCGSNLFRLNFFSHCISRIKKANGEQPRSKPVSCYIFNLGKQGI